MAILQSMPGTSRCVLALLAGRSDGRDSGVWREDEGASADGRSDSERIAALEAQMKSFQDYIVAQAQKERAAGGSLANGAAVEPQYTLAKENASENELEIVRWMADCTVSDVPEPQSAGRGVQQGDRGIRAQDVGGSGSGTAQQLRGVHRHGIQLLPGQDRGGEPRMTFSSRRQMQSGLLRGTLLAALVFTVSLGCQLLDGPDDGSEVPSVRDTVPAEQVGGGNGTDGENAWQATRSLR